MQYKYTLNDSEYRKLLSICKANGFEGRGSVSKFLKKVARTPFIFLTGSYTLTPYEKN